MTLQEQRDVLQAALDGKVIEYQTPDGKWNRCCVHEGVRFDFTKFAHRVRTQPREWWLVPCGVWLMSFSNSAAEAAEYIRNQDPRGTKDLVAIHVREVLEEGGAK